MANILLVSTSPSGKGGVASVVKTLLNSSLKEDHNFKHLTSHRDASKHIKLFSQICAYVSYPFLLKRNSIDIVHIHGSMKSSFFRKSYFLILGKLLGKKVIYHMHCAKIDEYFAARGYLKKKIVMWLMDRYDLIIALSSYWEEVLMQYTKTPIRILYNPVLPPNGMFDGSLINEKKDVLFLGEVCDRKGVHDLLKVAQIVGGNNSGIKFHIGGNGDLAKYKKMAEDLSLENVVWHGWVSGQDVDHLYEKSRLLFLPSYNEGLPMSILEAIAMGYPVVSTTVGGIPDSVIDGYNGFIHAPGDIQGFAQSILSICTDNPRAITFSDNSRKLADHKFAAHHIFDSLNQIYGGLM